MNARAVSASSIQHPSLILILILIMAATPDRLKLRDYRGLNFKGSGYSLTKDFDMEFHLLSYHVLVPEPTDLIQVQYGGLETKWELNYIITERTVRSQYFKDEDAFVAEAVAKCVVTQVEGPEIGKRGFMKLWQQISNDNGKPNKPCLIGPTSRHELEMLMTCTALQIKATPHLLGFGRATQRSHEAYPGGYIWYIIMEELSGTDTCRFYDLPLEERDALRLAALLVSLVDC
ncbi:hypothetical protein KEM56_002025 [Ascosphaera pollenicola]|nr:hypothetical protein KEM56_002025 [Ascosphaera pollenicola]